MQRKYSIPNHLAGTVHIDHAIGALSWDQKDLDPRPDCEVTELLKSLGEKSD